MARTSKSAENKTATNKKVTAATAAPETKAKAETNGAAAENQTTAPTHIYVGATLPGVPENTVFSGKTPDILNVPFVCELVIPIDKLTEFIKKKSVTTSREAFCYRKSAEYAKKLNQ